VFQYYNRQEEQDEEDENNKKSNNNDNWRAVKTSWQKQRSSEKIS